MIISTKDIMLQMGNYHKVIQFLTRESFKCFKNNKYEKNVFIINHASILDLIFRNYRVTYNLLVWFCVCL